MNIRTSRGIQQQLRLCHQQKARNFLSHSVFADIPQYHLPSSLLENYGNIKIKLGFII